MSECDKAKIVGYIEQTPEQIEAINLIKSFEISALMYLTEALNTAGNSDGRWASIGKTHLQQAFMAYVRAVARPNGD